ncbi:thermonuclease family protein [Longirhabdus pacifica]|uniref:thermonuclease family protein n=1 Tax=Longirhabdus pacifica TaxID=2305227 RepID=UPI001008CBB6|nr:thermonuclease family protein [Longirhabdus pacifica]
MRLILLIFSIILLFTGCQSEEFITDGKYTYSTYLSKDNKFGLNIMHPKQDKQNEQVFLAMVKLPYGNKYLNDKWIKKAHSFISQSWEKEYNLTVTILDRDYPQSTGFVSLKGQDIVVLLLEQGFLIVDQESKYKSKYPDKFQEYVAVEEIAIRKGVGIWAHLDVRGEN